MAEEPTRITDTRCITGEGPIYDSDRDALFWVDIPRGRLHRYDFADATHRIVYEREGAIGGFTLERDGALLLFEEAGRVERWHDGAVETIVSGIDGEADSRFNDVIADPEGRVFCGTMPTEDHEGRLYRLETDGSMTLLRDDVALPNGLGFTPDGSGLYFTESEASVIRRYDYDPASGEISNERLFVDFADETGIPDGMTVDVEGNVWSAQWDGGCVIGFRPDGSEFERVAFPAKKVSAITFGRPEYDTAYLTTALGPAPPSGTADGGSRDVEGDGAGAVFAVDLGIRGVPEFRSDVAAAP